MERKVGKGMDKVKEFKDLLINLIKEGQPNMGRNQVVDKINTAYSTYELIKKVEVN